MEVIEIEETIYLDKLVGFKLTPVFRYEDTKGEPLLEENFSIEFHTNSKT